MKYVKMRKLKSGRSGKLQIALPRHELRLKVALALTCLSVRVDSSALIHMSCWVERILKTRPLRSELHRGSGREARDRTVSILPLPGKTRGTEH